MKNDSHINPFPTMDDKFFDSNKDGKLSGAETIFRDAHHMEMADKAEQDRKTTSPSRSRRGSGLGGVSFTSIVLLFFFFLWLIDMLNK